MTSRCTRSAVRDQSESIVIALHPVISGRDAAGAVHAYTAITCEGRPVRRAFLRFLLSRWRSSLCHFSGIGSTAQKMKVSRALVSATIAPLAFAMLLLGCGGVASSGSSVEEPQFVASDDSLTAAGLAELGYVRLQGVDVELETFDFEKLHDNNWVVNFVVTVESTGERDVLASTNDFTRPVFYFTGIDVSDPRQTSLVSLDDDLPSSSLFVIARGQSKRLASSVPARPVTVNGEKVWRVDFGRAPYLFMQNKQYFVTTELPFSLYHHTFVDRNSDLVDISEMLKNELCALGFGSSPRLVFVTPQIK